MYIISFVWETNRVLLNDEQIISNVKFKTLLNVKNYISGKNIQTY